jgi:Mrp family chromosome partitioning ATPase
MARMLQALKNLEARSVRPMARQAERKQGTAGTGGEGTPGSVAESDLSTADELPSERVRPARRPEMAVPRRVQADPSPAAVELVQPQPEKVAPPDAPAELTINEPLAQPAIVEMAEKAPSRRATPLERQVKAALRDPARSKPLVELAERIERDAAPSNSKVIALVGLGAEGATHETTLYAATALAERAEGRVLVVDADLARRTLSQELDYRKAPGLGELLRGDMSAVERHQPTTVEKLMFLPAGGAAEADIAAAGARLEEVLEQLSEGFSLVLIDGGRTVDPGASTLARQADVTYFVVQLGTVAASEAQASLRDFRAAGARVVGCVAT